MAQITLANAVSGAATLVMTVATVFMGVVATKTYDLAEGFGRIDTRVGVIEAEFKSQTKTLEAVESSLAAGFKAMNVRFDRVDLRIGQMELSPEMLLAERGVRFEKDLKPIFYNGHIYAIARSPAASARLQKAGFKREILQGYLPAFLVVKDALPKP